jgi:hypothetical protein
MIRSWDTVSTGAFFPQAQLEPPQKKMRQHRREHMVVPPGVFAHFIVIHPQFGFPFFKQCAMAHRRPLSYTKVRRGVLATSSSPVFYLTRGFKTASKPKAFAVSV